MCDWRRRSIVGFARTVEDRKLAALKFEILVAGKSRGTASDGNDDSSDDDAPIANPHGFAFRVGQARQQARDLSSQRANRFQIVDQRRDERCLERNLSGSWRRMLTRRHDAKNRRTEVSSSTNTQDLTAHFVDRLAVVVTDYHYQ